MKSSTSKIERISSELESIIRTFLLFLKEEPQLDYEKHYERYVKKPEGPWLSNAIADAASFKQLCQIEIPLRFRYALIAQLFSVFETYAIKLADAIVDELKTDATRLADLRGSKSISGLKLFYTKIFPIHGFDWRYIEFLENCRNIVVHSNGYDTGVVSKGKIQKMLNEMQVIEFSSTNRLFLSKSACATFVTTCFIFFEQLFERCGHQMGDCSFSLLEPDEFEGFERRHEAHEKIIVKLKGSTLFKK